MNKQLSQEEISKCLSPVVIKPAPMTRRAKLMRWAMIVRKAKDPFVIFHNLEHYPQVQLAGIYHPGSAFAAAAADPILKDAGLQGETALDAMQFFELSQHELHEFSCNCGGVISNGEMANRIERIAGPGPVAKSQGKSLLRRMIG
jgi:hypothetical protein